MTTAVEVAERGHQLAAWVNFNGTFADTSGQSGTYACSGSTITITDTAHGLSVGDSIHAAFTRSAGDTTTITDDFFVVLTVPSADTFTIQTVVATTDQSGSVVYDSDAATATAGSGPIRAAYNVSSITDNGGSGGDYTITFATAMPDANYCVTASTGGNVLGVSAHAPANGHTLATGSMRVSCGTPSANVDPSYVHFAVFR
jgi:hypothetical protein